MGRDILALGRRPVIEVRDWMDCLSLCIGRVAKAVGAPVGVPGAWSLLDTRNQRLSGRQARLRQDWRITIGCPWPLVEAGP